MTGNYRAGQISFVPNPYFNTPDAFTFPVGKGHQKHHLPQFRMLHLLRSISRVGESDSPVRQHGLDRAGPPQAFGFRPWHLASMGLGFGRVEPVLDRFGIRMGLFMGMGGLGRESLRMWQNGARLQWRWCLNKNSHTDSIFREDDINPGPSDKRQGPSKLHIQVRKSPLYMTSCMSPLNMTSCMARAGVKPQFGVRMQNAKFC